MNTRLAAALAAATIALVPASGTAAPPPAPQIADAPGDAVAAQGSLDITAVRFTTTGTTTTRRVGKKVVKTYTPTALVVTMTLAAAPETRQGARYVVNADVAGCGLFNLSATMSYENIPVGIGWTDCPTSTEPAEGGMLLDPAVTYAGTTVTWKLGLKALPPQIKVRSVFSAFDAYVDLGDPVDGVAGTGDAASIGLGLGRTNPSHGKAVADFATGTGSWTLA